MATAAQNQQAKRRTVTWVHLSVLLLLSIALVGFPLFISNPFAHQAALPLSIALNVERWAPWLTLFAFLAGILVIIRGWAGRGERLRLAKNASLLAALAGLGVATWAARTNLSDLILFRPLTEVRFVPAARADLRPNDMVMAVSINGDERAYPVLQLAYHHVVNDVAGGVAIAATY